jgi:hypothetical protein
VLTAVRLADPREVLTGGLVDLEPAELEGSVQRSPIRSTCATTGAEVIESTELRAFFELRSEHDFTAAPREIEVGGAESLLHLLAGVGRSTV